MRRLLLLLLATLACTAHGRTTVMLGDLWWNPAELGWGLSIHQRDEQFFNVWFVYDEAGRPTWFVQPGGAWSGGFATEFSGAMYWPRGAPWFEYDASRLVPGAPIAEGNLVFNGRQQALASFVANIDGTMRPFGKTIVPQSFGSGEPGPFPGVGGLWWGGPSQNGWGVAIHEHGAQLFVLWFTYDADGGPTWFVMPEGTWTGERRFGGAIYRTVGPPWMLGEFDPANVMIFPAGSFQLDFDSVDAGRFEATVDGQSVLMPLVRQVF